MQIDSGMNVYEACIAEKKNSPKLDFFMLERGFNNLGKWLKDRPKGKYYMLLCNDRRDFTVFTLLDGEDKSAKAAFEMVDECLIPRGVIKDIDKTVDGYAIEIWLSIDDEIYCYYFFPYDNAIVEV